MLNKFRQSRIITSLLISSILFFSVQPLVNASIVTTSELVYEQQSNLDRNTLLKSLERADVQAVLINKGVEPETAKLRVAGMTDEEIKILNSKIDELPAGGEIIGVTDVYSFVN